MDSVLWRLDTSGRVSASEVARTLPDHDYYWVSSNQPKAWQTAEAMASVKGGSVVHRDTDFGEVRRPHVFTDNHRQLASSYVGGTVHEGWESHESVRSRFDTAVRRHMTRSGERNLVVTTHGMAMTTWLSTHIDLGDPARFWRGLALPDVIAVHPPRLDG